ncbi:hypothetical protein KM792_05990 [Clostridium tyrobutyricum]|jgi:hypothetical protein|uniref:hypothetical protein n=1 Tax=Clostridium tyrobutyricum TaxID=1519 RepID=UPI001C3CA6E0|nr:hypothetical protein [Clostridium tyrobutyricum]MBR9647368.1 hypothetical protein [Clostridium tyrobutyricum]MBV4417859.1 hypothetical protein [Clostridium tyrobutyricum]MBV4437393.1 hypothetical protein [Clostridium tyrobutyricum]MBV4449222.1 hypothetical protein [Clostridium tyrobutyricum]MCH4200175.1 hypothetical protein [Clostridium tyrobutyricum]
MIFLAGSYLEKIIDRNNITVENLRSTAHEIPYDNTYKENMINMSEDMKSTGE